MWDRLGTDEVRREMGGIVQDCAEALRDAGFPARGPRFPYSMHHAFFRSRLRIDGRKRTHAEVSLLLASWAGGRDDPCDYARQAVCGAVRTMVSRKPALAELVPDVVKSVMASVEDGAAFTSFASNRASDREAAKISHEGVGIVEGVLDELRAC